MKNLKKVLALSLSLSLALPLAACGDQGETEKGGGSTGSYPSSTITVVCPWDAGGTSDGLCRIVSEIGARDEYFGVNMVVQNSGGAGGTVATTEFKNAAPDGYTLCQEAIGVFTLQPFVREVSYTIDDFIPVAALSNEPIIMIAGKDSGITSVDDLLEMDSVTYGFSGSGSLMELSQKQFFGMAGVEATGISYDGSSPTIAALLGGHIDVCTGHPGEVMQYVESGDAVAIGIFNDERGRHGKGRRALIRAALAARPHHEHHEPEGADLLPRLLPAVRRAGHDGLGACRADARAGPHLHLGHVRRLLGHRLGGGCGGAKAQEPAS